MPAQSNATLRTLLVTNSQGHSRSVSGLLSSGPASRYELEVAHTHSAAVEIIRHHSHNIYLLSNRIGKHRSKAILREIADCWNEASAILHIDEVNPNTGTEEIEACVTDNIVIPPTIAHPLERLIHHVINRSGAIEVNIPATKQCEMIFDTIPDAICIIDANFLLQRVNIAMAGRLGAKPDESLGRPCYEVVHNSLSPPNFCPFAKMLKDGLEHSVEVYEPNLGGYFLVSVSPLYDDSGRMTGGIHVARDITAVKEAENVMREAHEGLEQRVAERTAELVEKAEHLEDLNTTLRVLLSERERERTLIQSSVAQSVKITVSPLLNVLKRANLSEEQTGYVRAIEDSLNNIFSTFVRSLSDRSLSLSPTELRVAEMVRAGKANKEIAETLFIGEGTVKTHREHLRKKLGLTNQKTNLRTYLQSMR